MDNDLSTILLDKQHVTVGETVMLFWHGSFTTSSTDWIGLFYSGDLQSVTNCLDYKQSGDITGKKGMKWLIGSNINFQQAENKCWFKYVHGASGSVKATSQTLHIINTDAQGSPSSPSGTLTTWGIFAGNLLEFTITGMEAINLKRTLFGRPSPYVKVNLRPGRMQRKAWRLHHGLIGKTSSQSHTTQPSWGNEVFEFKASIWDILEVEVRNRSARIKPTFSRFLGKLEFPLRELLTMGRSRTQTFTRQLMKREHSHKVLGTFSLTIKTNRDLPGSRRSRRLASPDGNTPELSLDSARNNGEHSNDENRRPSLNASTPDDDLTYRDRTGTSPVPCERTLAHVYADQNTDAQSQPDLLGLPYEAHDNVKIRKHIGHSTLSSRLSMPTFVLSNTSLRSFDNYPSTSGSFSTSMQLDNEDNEARTGQECSGSLSLDETINDNNDVTNTDIDANEQGSSNASCSNNMTVFPVIENNDSSLGDTNMETHLVESNYLSDPSDGQNDSTCNGVNDDVEQVSRDEMNEEELDVDTAGSLGVDHDELVETNVDLTTTNSVVISSNDNNVDENNGDRSDVNLSQDEVPQESNRTESLCEVVENSSEEHEVVQSSSQEELNLLSPTLCSENLPSTLEQPPRVPEQEAPSNEPSSSLTIALSSQDLPPSSEGLFGPSELPVDLEELPTISQEQPLSTQEGPSSCVEEPIIQIAEQPGENEDMPAVVEESGARDIESSPGQSAVVESSMVVVCSGQSNETTNSAGATADDIPSNVENAQGLVINNTDDIITNVEQDENTSCDVATSGGSSFSGFEDRATGQSFMDVELEPDIMNGLSISDPSSSEIVVSSNNCDGATSRRTLASCNLRTLFQVPDTENSRTTPPVNVAQTTDTIETNYISPNSVNYFGDEERLEEIFFRSLDNSVNTPVNQTAVSPKNHILGVFSNNGDEIFRSNTEAENNGETSTDLDLSEPYTITTLPSDNITRDETQSNHARTVSNGETSGQRNNISRVPSITHVHYLRSKRLSIRLPSSSSSSSPLPVVHVVPPHIPVTPDRNHQQDITETGFDASLIEAEPVLPATPLLASVTPSNESVNGEPSTSYNGATGASAGPSTPDMPHSPTKRRNNEGSHDDNMKVKRKNKSRSRTDHEVDEATNVRQPQERTRKNNEPINRQLNVPQTDQNNEQDSNDSTPRPASIYVQISDFPSEEEVSDEPLPQHWERAVDTYGRVYYIDHENRITTWVRPSAASSSETSLNEVNHHRQNLDRRYQSFRRTLSGRRRRNSRDNSVDDTNNTGTTTENTNGSSTRTSTISTATTVQATPRSAEPTESRTVSDNRLLLNSNFVKFLTRPDLITFLRSSGAAGQYYFSHPEVKDMVKRIRDDPRNYQRFMHDRSLVSFLNGFADASQPLPRGWEQKTDQFGQKYFVDHNSRSTNFADPRLPADTNTPRNRSRATLETAYADRTRRPPPPGLQRSNSSSNTVIRRSSDRRNRGEGSNMSYNQQIVEFLRQQNIDNVLSAKESSYASNATLRSSVEKIRRDGQRALRLLSDNVELIVLLSLFEDDIVSWVPEVKTKMPERNEKHKKRNLSNNDDQAGPSSRKTSKPAPYKRDFQAKVKSFHKNVIHKGLGQGPNKIQIIIRRDHILEDAFDCIMKENPKNLHKSKLEIRFSGEEGLDYGGPQREFFFLLSRQLFNPYYGLFEYSAQDTYTLHISAMSSFVDNAHEWYRFSGRIIALVIIHQHLLDAFFTRPFYKLLLKCSCDLRDVEALDALFHQSLAWIMETDITDVSLDLMFTVSEELGGQVTERELLPGGKDIRVNEDNKLGYVELMSNWRIDRGVSGQRKSILKGFYEIMDYELVSIFDACELELLISGTADIDVNDWFTNTEYRSGYHANHKVIRWFWQAVHSFDNEQRLRLLQFVTGTSSVPYEGFVALRGSTGTRKFCIEKWANHTMLPRAHTCFNRLDLPPYTTYNELLDKLTLAVEETSTFGIQ